MLNIFIEHLNPNPTHNITAVIMIIAHINNIKANGFTSSNILSFFSEISTHES